MDEMYDSLIDDEDNSSSKKKRTNNKKDELYDSLVDGKDSLLEEKPTSFIRDEMYDSLVDDEDSLLEEKPTSSIRDEMYDSLVDDKDNPSLKNKLANNKKDELYDSLVDDEDKSRLEKSSIKIKTYDGLIDRKNSSTAVNTEKSRQPSNSLPQNTFFFESFDFSQITRYEKINRIDAGGMGTVYLVFDKSLQRKLALKVIHVQQNSFEEQLRSYKQEVKLLASLNHPNVVKIFDASEVNGHYFFTMEYIEGKKFGNWVKEQKTLKKVLLTFINISKAVGYMHTQGIIHRDLKPDNIVIRDNGDPIVMDLGIAKDKAVEETLNQGIVGTFYYMSPEQCIKDSDIDERSDIFSLGVILYQILTNGKYPFKGDSGYKIMNKICCYEPIQPTKIKKALSKDLEAICLKCLEKRPQKRYPSAKSLVEDLQNYLDHKPITAKQYTTMMRLNKWIRRNKILSIAGGVVVFFTMVLVIFSIYFLKRQATIEMNLRIAKEKVLFQSLMSQTQLLLQQCKDKISEQNFVEAKQSHEKLGEVIHEIEVINSNENNNHIAQDLQFLKKTHHDIYNYEIYPHPHQVESRRNKKLIPLVAAKHVYPIAIFENVETQQICLYNLQTQSEIQCIDIPHGNKYPKAAVSPNKKYFAYYTGNNNHYGKLTVQKVDSNNAEISIDFSTVTSITFSNNSQYLCIISANSLYIFDIVRKQKIHHIKSNIQNITFSKNDEYLYVIEKHKIKVFDFKKLLTEKFFQESKPKLLHVSTTALKTQNNFMYYATRNNKIYKQAIYTKGHEKVIESLALNFDGRVRYFDSNHEAPYSLILTNKLQINIWSFREEHEMFRLSEDSNSFTNAACFDTQKDDIYFFNHSQNKISIFPKSTKDILLKEDPFAINSMLHSIKNELLYRNLSISVMSNDEKYLAYDDFDSLYLCNLENLEKHVLYKHKQMEYLDNAITQRKKDPRAMKRYVSMFFSRDNRYLFSNFAGNLVVWDIKTKSKVKLINPFSSVEKFWYDDKKDMLFVINKNSLQTQSFTMKKNRFTKVEGNQFVAQDRLYLNPSISEKFLLQIDNQMLKILDKKTLKNAYAIPRHEIDQQAISSGLIINEKLVVLASITGVIHFVDFVQRKKIYELKLLRGRVKEIKYDKDRKELWYFTIDGISITPSLDVMLSLPHKYRTVYPLNMYKKWPFTTAHINNRFDKLIVTTQNKVKIIPLLK